MVRHAPTGATRTVAFPVDEPLDERGRAAARSLARAVPANAALVSSPALRCVQTAEATGRHFDCEPQLAECDFGRWAGTRLADVAASDRDAARAWMAEPDACPHGGESLSDFARRVAEWLDAQAAERGALVAITHAGVVRAALVRALGAPIEAFWHLDVAPLSVTEMHAHDGRWTVTRANHPLPEVS
jgi:broad specificity phosphatase PhoE